MREGTQAKERSKKKKGYSAEEEEQEYKTIIGRRKD